MKTVQVRDLTLGAGMPKICIPLVAAGQAELINEARQAKALRADLVEWRADWFQAVGQPQAVRAALAALRETLGNVPLLFTFRTLQEGGAAQIDTEDYLALARLAVDSGQVDLIDLELFSCTEEQLTDLIQTAHLHQVKVVVSSHDFKKTPSKEVLLRRLIRMQELGADLPKIAVMPQQPKDVLILLSATEEMATHYATGPIITMAMAGSGLISRLCGELFGSALTFGSAARASAPGQIDAAALRQLLTLFHENL